MDNAEEYKKELALKTMNELIDLEAQNLKKNYLIDKELKTRTDEYKKVEAMPEQTTSHGNNINKVSNMLNQNALEEKE